MASYSSPSHQDTQDTTGVNYAALGLSRSELNALLGKLRARAEADVAQQIGTGTFAGSDLESTQVTLLQEAVCYATARRFLGVCRVRKADGTYEPLLVEDSRSLGEIMDDWDAEVKRLAGLVKSAGEGTADQQYLTGFSDADTPAFTREMGW